MFVAVGALASAAGKAAGLVMHAEMDQLFITAVETLLSTEKIRHPVTLLSPCGEQCSGCDTEPRPLSCAPGIMCVCVLGWAPA